MSLLKAINSGKEHRKHYRGASAVSTHCRNHNPKYCQCPWCVDNRLHKNKKRDYASLSELKNIIVGQSEA